MGIITMARHRWNAFMNRDPTVINHYYGGGYSHRPDRNGISCSNERSIVSAILNRIALDVAAVRIEHVQLDENFRYDNTIRDELNDCFNLSANLDQTGRAMIQDAAMSLMDEGSIAIVPIETYGLDPLFSDSFTVCSVRVAKILEWRPADIKVRVYNETTGLKEDMWFPKRIVVILENPLYTVMNEPSSTLRRLIRKMNILDVIDEQSGSGKLDLIIQLPYVIKNRLKKDQAETRRAEMEAQLAGSKYGVAYIDGTEHITQLNRPVDNNLMTQIQFLTGLLFSQLGMTQGILDGTADEKTMISYQNRLIEPFVSVIVDETKRKWLSKTARSLGQTMMAFKDPFKFVTVSELAEVTDKLTRNEVSTSNEMRQVIGWKPSKDPNADKLQNKNLNQPENNLDGNTTNLK